MVTKHEGIPASNIASYSIRWNSGLYIAEMALV